MAMNNKLSAIVAVVTTSTGVDGFFFNELPKYLSLTATTLGIVLAGYLILVNHRIYKKTKLEIEILKEQAIKNKSKGAE